MLKHELKLKKEFIKDLYETYPNAFEIKEKKVRVKNNINFIKLMKRDIETQKWIIENLGVTYIWYLDLLINWLMYDNLLDFWELKKLWIKEWMIKVVRKKLIDWNIVKKRWRNFYLNPMIAMKWEALDPEIINLFK